MHLQLHVWGHWKICIYCCFNRYTLYSDDVWKEDEKKRHRFLTSLVAFCAHSPAPTIAPDVAGDHRATAALLCILVCVVNKYELNNVLHFFFFLFSYPTIVTDVRRFMGRISIVLSWFFCSTIPSLFLFNISISISFVYSFGFHVFYCCCCCCIEMRVEWIPMSSSRYARFFQTFWRKLKNLCNCWWSNHGFVYGYCARRDERTQIYPINHAIYLFIFLRPQIFVFGGWMCLAVNVMLWPHASVHHRNCSMHLDTEVFSDSLLLAGLYLTRFHLITMKRA